MFRSRLRNLPLRLEEVGTPSKASDHGRCHPWIRDFVNMEIDTKLVSDWRVDETKLNAKASFEWNSC